MTSTTERNGRLGNQIIRNLAVSLLAKKYNLRVDYSSKDLINKLGIVLFNGSNKYKYTRILDDTNYFSIYNFGKLYHNLNPNRAYFQTKEICNFVYDYLQTDIIKSNIIKNNPFKRRYIANNDLYIHIRLTDVAHFNPGIGYYLNTIRNINFDNIYISTDDKNHDVVKTLVTAYPTAKVIYSDEITTIQFASTCKNIILSHGSFSAVIGYLSFFSTIYYPEYGEQQMWHGDMFSIDGWIKCGVE